MTHLLLTLQNEEDEKEMASFLSSHPNVLAVKQESEVDEDGNFRLIDLHLPGVPVSDEYMNWHLEKSNTEVENGEITNEKDFTDWYLETRKQLLKASDNAILASK